MRRRFLGPIVGILLASVTLAAHSPTQPQPQTPTPTAGAAVPARDPLAAARDSYNQQQYERAIELALDARGVPALSNAAAVVLARAHLERYRSPKPDRDDLSDARDALKQVDATALSPRDGVEFLIGLGESLFFEGQSLYLEDRFGAAAELFQSALDQAALLDPDARESLFEWWATALDRQAQAAPEPDRKPTYLRVLRGAEAEVAHDHRSASGSYWLAAAARGSGDLERALGAAEATWIRADEFGPRSGKLRADLERLVVQVILPERALRLSPESDARPMLATLQAQWEAFKARWGR